MLYAHRMVMKRGIFARLILWFLVISLVPLSAVAYMAYVNGQQHLKKEVTNQLRAIADTRARLIEIYVLERSRDVSALSRMPTIIDAMEDLERAFDQSGIDSPAYTSVEHEVRPFLTYYKEAAGYYDLFLISTNGNAIFSVNKGEDLGSNYRTGVYKHSILAKVFDKASMLLETQVSDFDYYQATNEPAAFIAAPVIKDGEVIGVVALQVTNREVYALAQNYAGLGQTGEILIGAKINDKAVFMTPVRHDINADFRRRITIGSDREIALQEAVQGTRGDGVVIDYLGNEVLAVWRYQPAFGWGVVVKIDTAEAFSPIMILRTNSFIIATIAMLLVVLAAWLVSRSISNPIRSLTQSARVIAKGDLSHKASVPTTDEIGELAGAFNRMTTQVRERSEELASANAELLSYQGSLEAQVDTRTAELARANDKVREWGKKLEGRVQEQVTQLDRLGRLKGFFSPQLAESILSGGGEDLLKTHRREVVVVFLDLRGFTAFTDSFEPEEVMAVLGEYHRVMGQLVVAHEGTLERFAGDGLMIFFNDPVELDNPAASAVKMALAMQQQFVPLAAAWKVRGYDLDLSIGIAQGYATLGAIGFEGRWDYACIGSVTNLAARLCDEAKGGQIITTKKALAQIEGMIQTEAQADLMLKGIAKPVQVLNVTGLSPDFLDCLALS